LEKLRLLWVYCAEVKVQRASGSSLLCILWCANFLRRPASPPLYMQKSRQSIRVPTYTSSALRL
jgi:hypothetical protein